MNKHCESSCELLRYIFWNRFEMKFQVIVCPWTFSSPVKLSVPVHSFNLRNCPSLYISLTCDIVCPYTFLSPVKLSVPVHYFHLQNCLSLYIPFICEIVCPCAFLHHCNGLSLFPDLWTVTDILMDGGNFIRLLTECTVDRHYMCITMWKISFETLTHLRHSRAAPSQLKIKWTGFQYWFIRC